VSHISSTPQGSPVPPNTYCVHPGTEQRCRPTPRGRRVSTQSRLSRKRFGETDASVQNSAATARAIIPVILPAKPQAPAPSRAAKNIAVTSARTARTLMTSAVPRRLPCATGRNSENIREEERGRGDSQCHDGQCTGRVGTQRLEGQSCDQCSLQLTASHRGECHAAHAPVPRTRPRAP
jgi:hypothetical protein